MTKPKPRPSAFPHRRRSFVTPWTVGVGATMLGLAVLLAVAVSGDTARTGDSGRPARTGEVNAMGMPVVETRGAATGGASAGPVEVAGASWALGVVPLNTAVRPHWVLRNTGTEPVTLGEPKAEVRTGCCPGPFTLSSQAIPPGGSSTLTFELAMHPGMDGWHDIGVHVPVTAGGAQENLTLDVTGDFRNS